MSMNIFVLSSFFSLHFLVIFFLGGGGGGGGDLPCCLS